MSPLSDKRIVFQSDSELTLFFLCNCSVRGECQKLLCVHNLNELCWERGKSALLKPSFLSIYHPISHIYNGTTTVLIVEPCRLTRVVKLEYFGLHTPVEHILVALSHHPDFSRQMLTPYDDIRMYQDLLRIS